METANALMHIVITATIFTVVVGAGVALVLWWADCGDRQARAVASIGAGLFALTVTALAMAGLTSDNAGRPCTRPSAPVTVDGGVN